VERPGRARREADAHGHRVSVRHPARRRLRRREHDVDRAVGGIPSAGRAGARSGEEYGDTTVDVEELERILAGTTSLEMFEPLTTGVWITYHNDTVSTIVHQYRP
jgi:hypothetical protein